MITKIKQKNKTKKADTQKITGFTCGSFDLTHAGHYLMFKECKKHCNYLIVGLQTDPTIDRPEKNKPVQSIVERKIQLESCKYVDQIILYKTEKDLLNILKNTKIDTRFIGKDWKGKNFTGKELSIKIFWNNRDHGYSSRVLRTKVFQAELRKLPSKKTSKKD
ncbi:MAG: adenylyltransferase/cytidyltransferase family protein [Candidatus Pacebacteria bacterium]|nr:adenylyltransferase/cytidyltransferase family protein [Candidatus Paceibacterota bacterium]MCF7862607.1 adenylyltransferase/cytidyltransferase family protein [Candidatus Paceibacterota bacterium]